ncbi:hypothetical protein CJF42_09840 [Pseudoalteromonas sp. NBT06-2]|uniref:hypothetical protein n=1 Tax=Pseudoalteromonas sp. NBT06-2 TaxID=2025950 RepID=UPI000BA556B4|nr:hypothetical protein [Pseudoalteromonas sp. NBT06-2]PAJ74609.1 hypothetical protein CJF42_09840 [Pseudoalteromonas sp. NBT06-2]
MIKDTKTMNLTTLTEKINAVFELKKLFALARERNFIKRHRQINPQKLLLSVGSDTAPERLHAPHAASLKNK